MFWQNMYPYLLQHMRPVVLLKFLQDGFAKVSSISYKIFNLWFLPAHCAEPNLSMDAKKRHEPDTLTHKLRKLVAMQLEMKGPSVLKVSTSHFHVCYKGFVAEIDLEILESNLHHRLSTLHISPLLTLSISI